MQIHIFIQYLQHEDIETNAVLEMLNNWISLLRIQLRSKSEIYWSIVKVGTECPATLHEEDLHHKKMRIEGDTKPILSIAPFAGHGTSFWGVTN